MIVQPIVQPHEKRPGGDFDMAADPVPQASHGSVRVAVMRPRRLFQQPEPGRQHRVICCLSCKRADGLRAGGYSDAEVSAKAGADLDWESYPVTDPGLTHSQAFAVGVARG